MHYSTEMQSFFNKKRDEKFTFYPLIIDSEKYATMEQWLLRDVDDDALFRDVNNILELKKLF